MISGWACDAEEVLLVISGGRAEGFWREIHKAAHGTIRLDTLGVCGDVHNGFSLLFNWNNIDVHHFVIRDDGERLRAIKLYIDGVEVSRTQVQVLSFGEELLRGAPQTEYTLDTFSWFLTNGSGAVGRIPPEFPYHTNN